MSLPCYRYSSKRTFLRIDELHILLEEIKVRKNWNISFRDKLYPIHGKRCFELIYKILFVNYLYIFYGYYTVFMVKPIIKIVCIFLTIFVTHCLTMGERIQFPVGPNGIFSIDKIIVQGISYLTCQTTYNLI